MYMQAEPLWWMKQTVSSSAGNPTGQPVETPQEKKCKGESLMIPKDPVMLLSYVNTQLRDYADSLEALCCLRGIDQTELIEKIGSIGYQYDQTINQFTAKE